MSATAPALPRRAGARDRRAADRLRSVVRGRPADPVWVRPSLSRSSPWPRRCASGT